MIVICDSIKTVSNFEGQEEYRNVTSSVYQWGLTQRKMLNIYISNGAFFYKGDSDMHLLGM